MDLLINNNMDYQYLFDADLSLKFEFVKGMRGIVTIEDLINNNK